MNKWLLVLTSLFLMSSCTLLKKKPSSKNITIDSTGTTDPQVVKSFKDNIIGPEVYLEPDNSNKIVYSPNVKSPETKALIDMLMPIWQQHTDYKTFKGKAKMHYEGEGQRQDFTANIRMAKDSLIWIHITAGMGIVNVARMMITPDSFQLVNYLEKSCMKLSITEVERLIPVSIDFNLLQNFILGEALTESSQKPMDAADFRDTWTMFIDGLQADQRLAFNKTDSTIRSTQILSSTGFAGMIQYGNYSMVDSRKFAISRAINFTSKNAPYYVDMNFNNASFDIDMNFPFNIPESYTLNK